MINGVNDHFLSSASKFATPAPGNPFHIAIPVHCLSTAREFYGNILGLVEGRRDENKWQDYSLFGHQIVCHYVGSNYRCIDYFNPVDGDEVPVPHYGCVLTEEQFHTFATRLQENGVQFIIPPHKRFEGQIGEQWVSYKLKTNLFIRLLKRLYADFIL